MRADRLLSLLLLLQSRGRMTAAALARELEVSERTVYRDIDALSSAGVPVYGIPGPEGGFALLDSFRTNLTGLTAGEVRALFMLNVPAPLVDLGVSQTLATALRKLSASLPEERRRDETWVRQRIYLDATGWQYPDDRPSHLQTIHQAVCNDHKLWLVYNPLPAIEMERLVVPYGLVAKAGIWYLVAARHERVEVFLVSDLVEVRATDAPFVRPAGFDLAAFWQHWCAQHPSLRMDFVVTVRVAPLLAGKLDRIFANAGESKIVAAAPPAADGWVPVELAFTSFAAARSHLLSFGRAVEVLSPRPLRRSLHDFAEQIVNFYTSKAH
jgi:predicted DNA-binding transcriptional regulator YafY